MTIILTSTVKTDLEILSFRMSEASEFNYLAGKLRVFKTERHEYDLISVTESTAEKTIELFTTLQAHIDAKQAHIDAKNISISGIPIINNLQISSNFEIAFKHHDTELDTIIENYKNNM